MKDSLEDAFDDRSRSSMDARGQRTVGSPLAQGGRGRYVAPRSEFMSEQESMRSVPSRMEAQRQDSQRQDSSRQDSPRQESSRQESQRREPAEREEYREQAYRPAARRRPVESYEEPDPGRLERAVHAAKIAMPLVQKLLPLLDGPLNSILASVLGPRPAAQSAPPAAAPAPVQAAPLAVQQVAPATSTALMQDPGPDLALTLAPLEEGIHQLQTGHQDLIVQVVQQNSSLKRVEDRLEAVREATDRNTLEQQELMDDLKSVGKKVNLITLVLTSMLMISMLLNLVLYLHMQRVLP